MKKQETELSQTITRIPQIEEGTAESAVPFHYASLQLPSDALKGNYCYREVESHESGRHTMNDRIRVLIADDQPRARQSLKALLSTLPQIEGVREALSSREAIRLIEERQPDLVLFDIRMPEMEGLEAVRHVRSRWPKVKIIVLSLHEDCSPEALSAGADAFVSKGEPPQRLLDALATVASPPGIRRDQIVTMLNRN